MRENNVEVRK